jgi:SAM-dependent methyltransferase
LAERLRLSIGFRLRGPWVTRFVINGRAYGGWHDSSADPRPQWFFDTFPDVRTILDLGCLEGGHTFALAAHPGVERVVGVEVRRANLRRAEYVRRVTRSHNVEFVAADLETFDLSSLGRFDAVFCSGLLYHLPRPWELLAGAAAVADRLFLWTHYTDTPTSDLCGYPGAGYAEHGLADVLSGVSPVSFWPTRDGLLRMLADVGYTDTSVVLDDPAHQDGPVIALGAAKPA